jgi:hypothetical protein
MKIAWVAQLLASGFVLGAPEHNKACRCLSSDSCWPSESEFSLLASELSQPLLHPLPPASACYSASTTAGNCSDVVQHANDGNWLSDLPGNMQNTNFETYTFPNGTITACYLNTTLGVPCTQGSIPILGVDARSPADIQAAVKFANKHNLRLVVKNTG